jgi:hypothetical protein
MALHYSFDVEIRQGSRWVIDSTREREYPARQRANELLANPKCPGARIIRTWVRADGVGVDTEIFCQTRELQNDEKLRITPVDAPIGKCHTLQAFFSFESRQLMSRIFRTYLAGTVLTPTEIIHNVWHLKRIQEKDGLVRAAVEMVATLQTTDGAQSSSARRTELYQAIDAMVDRAGTIDTSTLPKLNRKFSEVMAQLGDGMDDDRRHYVMLAALSRDLGKQPGWVGKLALLCDMADAESEPEALGLLDGVMADVLGIDVNLEILGVQPTRLTTILALLDLAAGIAPVRAATTGDVCAGLCRLLACGKLPASRRSIIARTHRVICAPGLLVPNDPEHEPQALGRIIARMLIPSGLLGGPDTAHALTQRYSRIVEQGGKTGRRAAMKGVFQAMPDLAYGTIYLCDLGRSHIAQDHMADLEDLLAPVLTAPDLRCFCQPDLEPQASLARATAAYHAVANAPFLPAIKASVCEHIDILLERFVIGEAIIDKLGEAGGHLRDRAERLVRFCQSGLLPKGRALKAAQGRVVSLLKQSDFPARFVEGIDDPQAARMALRAFYALLKGSGLHDA